MVKKNVFSVRVYLYVCLTRRLVTVIQALPVFYGFFCQRKIQRNVQTIYLQIDGNSGRHVFRGVNTPRVYGGGYIHGHGNPAH